MGVCPKQLNLFEMNTEEKKVFRLMKEAQTGDKAVSVVYESTDYASFETFKGNREPDHVGQIVASMIEYGSIDKPIICTLDPFRPNVKLIADGNNSINARIQLGLPIYYVLIENLTEREMIALNLTNKNWTSKNYVSFYAQKGYSDYMVFQNLMNEYPDFTCRSIECILRLSTTADGSSVRTSRFDHSLARGLFKCKDTQRSLELINVLLKIKKIENDRSKIYRNDFFVQALVRCFNYKPFDCERLIKKIDTYPFLLVKQADVQGYIELIEKIYNYRQKEGGYVSLGSLKVRK